MRESCYLCGTEDNLTRDHVPPKNLFLNPLPDNLITLPCCKKCNSSFSKDDEAFRLWVSTSAFASPTAKKIWDEKIAPSFQKRNHQLAKNIQEYIGTKILETPIGKVEFPTFSIPQNRVVNYLIRLTKGLLRHHYPNYDYSETPFLVNHILLSNEQEMIVLYKIINLMTYNELGNGVFRYWHGFAVDSPESGIWVYTFYDGSCFLVFHGKNY